MAMEWRGHEPPKVNAFLFSTSGCQVCLAVFGGAYAWVVLGAPDWHAPLLRAFPEAQTFTPRDEGSLPCPCKRQAAAELQHPLRPRHKNLDGRGRQVRSSAHAQWDARSKPRRRSRKSWAVRPESKEANEAWNGGLHPIPNLILCLV